jgi:hypothetical protein
MHFAGDTGTLQPTAERMPALAHGMAAQESSFGPAD